MHIEEQNKIIISVFVYKNKNLYPIYFSKQILKISLIYYWCQMWNVYCMFYLKTLLDLWLAKPIIIVKNIANIA